MNPKYDEVWGRPCLASDRRAPSGRRSRRVRGAGPRRRPDDRRRAALAACAGSWSSPPGSRRRATRAAPCRTSSFAAAERTGIPVLGPNVEGFVNYVDRVAPYGTTPPPDPVAGGDQRDQPVGNRGVDDESARVRSRGRVCGSSSASATRRWSGSATCSSGRRRTRRRSSSSPTSRRCATSRASVAGSTRSRDARKPILVCAPAGRSEAARRSIVAHTGALAGNTALRDAWLRRPRRDPRGGPGHDVRGGGPAVAPSEAADDGRGRGAAVRRRVHALRRGCRRARVSRCPGSPRRRSAR